MKNLTIFVLSVAASAFFSCSSVRTSEHTRQENNTEHSQNDQKDIITVQLQENQNMQVTDTNLNISFLKVTEDSRCPENVQCVWAGVAVAQIEVMNPFSRPMKFSLATQNLPDKGYSKSANYQGYHIELKSIATSKTFSATTETSGKKTPYSITLEISKASGESTPKEATSR